MLSITNKKIEDYKDYIDSIITCFITCSEVIEKLDLYNNIYSWLFAELVIHHIDCLDFEVLKQYLEMSLDYIYCD